MIRHSPTHQDNIYVYVTTEIGRALNIKYLTFAFVLHPVTPSQLHLHSDIAQLQATWVATYRRERGREGRDYLQTRERKGEEGFLLIGWREERRGGVAKGGTKRERGWRPVADAVNKYIIPIILFPVYLARDFKEHAPREGYLAQTNAAAC